MTQKTRDLAQLLLTPIQFQAFLTSFDDVVNLNGPLPIDFYISVIGKPPAAHMYYNTSVMQEAKNELEIYKSNVKFIDMLLACELETLRAS